jgi:hypothetical protein
VRAAGLALGLLVVAVGPATAEERRLDQFDPQGHRTGHVIVDGQRLDLYDANGRRIGSGRRDERTGDVEVFDKHGRRSLTIRPEPKGRIPR